MKHICELRKILEEHFDWNKSRLTVLVSLLIGLFMVRTVNLILQLFYLGLCWLSQQSHKALKKYKKRWAIETLFGYFKTKGFNFEATHMTDPDKVAAWMLLLTVAAAWTMKTSLMYKEKIHVAAHGRPRKRVFRNGFERLRRCLLQPFGDRWREIFHYIYLLSKTKCPLDMVWAMLK